MYEKVFPEKKDIIPAEIENILKSLDFDGDGTIDFYEFIVGTLGSKDILKEKNLQRAFNIFDIDKDGKITWNEIKNIIGQDLQNISDE